MVGTLISAKPLGHHQSSIGSPHNFKPAGDIVVDQGGSTRPLCISGKSLLPSGLQENSRRFGVGECVRCLDSDGQEFARGLVNYSAQELNQIKGLHTSRIEKVLGL